MSADIRNLLLQLSAFIIIPLSAISADLCAATPTTLALKPRDSVKQNSVYIDMFSEMSYM